MEKGAIRLLKLKASKVSEVNIKKSEALSVSRSVVNSLRSEKRSLCS